MMAETVNKDSKINPEVVEKAARRRFSATYKAQILAEADLCTTSNELCRESRQRNFVQLWTGHLTAMS
jgi:hypothetical protein